MTLTFFHSPAVAPSRRGEHLGTTWRPDIAASWRAYELVFADYEIPDAMVRSVAEEALAQTRAWSPSLAEEIVGIARGAGLDLWKAAALSARSEVLAKAGILTPGECSTSVFLPEAGAPRTIQTWDWHHAMDRTKLVWQYDAAPGWTVKTFTEFGLLAKIGVNSAGLGVHFNLLQHDDDGGETGVPVHAVARRVLEGAATVDEAEGIIRSAPVSASVALTVVAYDGVQGDGCTFEVSPAGTERLPMRPDRFLLHTNHFLHAELARGERLATVEPDTRHRLVELERRARALESADVNVRTRALLQHREQGSALCCHPTGDTPWETHVVISLDLARGRLLMHDGPPCRATENGWLRS